MALPDTLKTDSVLCCDWGTTSFRLQLVSTADFRCLGDIQSPTGVAVTFDAWKQSDQPRGLFYRRQIRQQIDLLAASLSRDLATIPVVMSGMASSSIGLEDIPYASLPFAVDGSQARSRYVARQDDFPHAILLISGVSSEQDVMRGEETQLIGLMALLEAENRKINDAIYIFPGTHSKHLRVQNRQLVQFKTYMTGELFSLLANQSILKDSLDLSTFSELTSDDLGAFKQGVQQSTQAPLLHSLFTVRTNQLFKKLTQKHNALYLSGLLIGSELNQFSGEKTEPLILCTGSNLSIFYQAAIDALQLTNRTHSIPAELIDKAASAGQVRLFQHQQTRSETR